MIITWIAVVLSLIGMIFNARKNLLCWPFYLTSSSIWVLFYLFGDNHIHWPDLTVWILLSFGNIYGWISWSNKRKNNVFVEFINTYGK